MVHVVAPTNLAALNVGGITTYNYAGWHVSTNIISLGKLKKNLLENMEDEEFKCTLQETDVLVIDEVSMMESNFFERLNEVMKCARRSSKAFGGVQMVVTGDFCQLPPILPFRHCFRCGASMKSIRVRGQKRYPCKNKCGDFLDIQKYAFLSNVWKECRFECVHLTEIHRQGDTIFQSILQKIRLIGIDAVRGDIEAYLLQPRSGMEGAIQIFPHNEDVRYTNAREVENLPGEARVFQCKDFVSIKDDDAHDEHLRWLKSRKQGPIGDESHRYEKELTLKKDICVVLTKNLSPHAGLVNGSQGRVVDFEVFDLEKLTKKKMGLSGPHARYCQDEIERFCEKNAVRDWPIVEFDNGQRRTIYPDCLVSEYGSGNPRSRISRTQVPLMAGYAMTIHKAQGMSLDRVKVNLEKALEEEMVYVALSRARSLDRLEVVALPDKPLGGPNRFVKQFYDSFSNA